MKPEGFTHERNSGDRNRIESSLEEGARKRARDNLPYANQAAMLKDENTRLQSKVISEMDARLNSDGIIEALRKENEELRSNLVKETSMRKSLEETLNEAQADFDQVWLFFFWRPTLANASLSRRLFACRSFNCTRT